MLYNFTDTYYRWLADHGLGFFRLFLDAKFRAVAAILLAFVVVILLGKRVIRVLVMLKIGDRPEFHNKTLNEITKDKSNTPTMGGVLISFAILLPTLLLADLNSFYVHMALLCILWLALLGGFDDYLKLTNARRGGKSRQGLHSWEKLVFQLGLAVVLGLFIHHYGSHNDPDVSTMTFSLNLPFVKTWVYDAARHSYVPSPELWKLSSWAFVLVTVIVITGSSNAVNLTDGMDGLASGIMTIVAFAFMVLSLLAGDEDFAKRLLIPYVPRSEELAIVAGSIVGACLGFLWFNCNPAQVFMGDTGSLPLGGIIGYIAVVIRQEFLLLIIGGVFVMEALSVMIQVGVFKWTKNRPQGPLRFFKMAPIHHHFHLLGWPEQRVVVRFWLMTAVLVALALCTIKLR